MYLSHVLFVALWEKRDSCHYFQIAGGRCDHVSHGFPLHCSASIVRHLFFSITKILLLANRVSGRSLKKGVQHLEEKPACRVIGGASHNKAAEAKRFLAGQRSSVGACTVLRSVVVVGWWIIEQPFNILLVGDTPAIHLAPLFEVQHLVH